MTWARYDKGEITIDELRLWAFASPENAASIKRRLGLPVHESDPPLAEQSKRFYRAIRTFRRTSHRSSMHRGGGQCQPNR